MTLNYNDRVRVKDDAFARGDENYMFNSLVGNVVDYDDYKQEVLIQFNGRLKEWFSYEAISGERNINTMTYRELINELQKARIEISEALDCLEEAFRNYKECDHNQTKG